ncbi:MAG: nuclear transport factor 2 family protein, partial [Bacteroidota bacterium]|nr:nuclear transport factor 2 family protein [Bacteroidota bacterium]
MNEEKVKLLQDTHKAFMDLGLGGHAPLSELDQYIAEDIMGFGTTVDEKMFFSSELRDLLKRQREQTNGLQLQWKIKQLKLHIAPDGNAAFIADDVFLHIITPAETIEMYMRYSSVWEFHHDRWISVHFHGSKPENVASEQDTFGLETWKQQKAELLQLVEEKTVDLRIKNRELEIESSLERVRSIAMGMKQPADMLDVCKIISDQLQLLLVADLRNVQTAIIDREKSYYINYQYFTLYQKGTIESAEYNKHPKVRELVEQMQRSPDAFFVASFEGEELDIWRQYRKDDNQFPDPVLDNATAVYFYFYSIGHGGLGVSTYIPLTEEHLTIFKQFRNVFNLSYQRYADIALAEAQAREAKIEAALERTRTQSMIMQHSKELDDTLRVFHKQVLLLGINSAFSYLWLPDEEKDKHKFWAAWSEDKGGSAIFKSKAIDYPLDSNEPATAKCLVDWKSDVPVHSYALPPGEVENYFATWAALLDGVEKLKPEHFPGGLYYVEAYMKYGCFGVMIESELTEDEKQILGRFAIEFERAYTRFLDLQKAESQAREARIEAALERVRSRSLAMHKANELGEVVLVIVEKIKELNIEMNGGVTLVTFEPGSKDFLEWHSNPGQIGETLTGLLSYFNHPVFNDCIEAVEQGVELLAKVYPKEEKDSYIDYLAAHTDYIPGDMVQWVHEQECMGFSFAIQKHSGIFLQDFTGKFFSKEENDILIRFSRVFEQSYIRFLDLQKAEAQAREAQIEAAMERVRSRTMAMQKSEELHETSQILFQQMKELGEPVEQLTIGIVKETENVVEVFATVQGSQLQQSFRHSIDEPTVMNKIYRGWKAQQKSLLVEMNSDEIQVYNRYRNELVKSEMFSTTLSKDERRIIYAAYFSKGMLALSS